ncbi:hypothetical protein EGW08_018350 [Elysia chlorotica]|uniref:Endonuclease/exonuclease/phosphatase domain-containing protein n=1 Tax=Elysia chlorotica TaxID=188477 RepID=A0A3S1B1J3_ELYCH|nr:hypothetical protein EGW08_018350 [Elysia chlorotica]
MTQASESLREASLSTVLLTTKTKTRTGTWNIRTLYETGKIAQVSKEMKEYSLKILELCETRWTGADRRTLYVLLYGSETWRTTKTNTTKLQTFINGCLKYILKVRWPQTISNEELWRRTEQTPIDIQIKKRKWGWIGHTLRKPPTDIMRQSLEWNPQGKRKVGRPKQTWRRSMEAEIRSAGRTWTELKRDAQNRVRWRGVALALCSSGDPDA